MMKDRTKGLLVLAIPLLLLGNAIFMLDRHYEDKRRAYSDYAQRCNAAGGVTVGYDSPACVSGYVDIDKVCVVRCGTKAGSR